MKILDKLKERGFAIRLLGGFFVIMFALTVLSRMADSITIPTVKVSSPKNSKIIHEVELEGTLEPKDETNIEVSSGFMIKKVHTKKGDKVSKGDRLMTLDTKMLEDKLLQAEMALKEIELQIQQLILDIPLPEDENPITEAELMLKRIQEDRELVLGGELSKVERAKEDLKLAEEDLRLAQEKLELLKGKNQEEQLKKAEEAVSIAEKNLEDKKYERDKALKTAQMAIDDAYAQYDSITTGSSYVAYQAVERARTQYKMVEDDWKRTIKDYEEELSKAKEKLEKIKKGEINEEDIRVEEQNIQSAQRNLDAKKRALEDSQKGNNSETVKVERLLEDAQIQLEKAKNKEEKSERTAENQKIKLDLQKSLLELKRELKIKEINGLREIEINGGIIQSPIDGVITEVRAEEGAQTTGANLITMVDKEATYNFVATINEEQEKYLQIGDEVSITLQGEDRPLEGTVIDNIINVPGEDGSKRQVYVTLPKGEPGITAKMNSIKETEKYSSVLPIGVLREDQTGKYVLVVREENTTLGDELVVARVEVQVVDKNQTFVAIRGGINSKDKVIVESNKTIEVGDRVRLSE